MVERTEHEAGRHSAVGITLGLGWLLATMTLWVFAFAHAGEATPEWLLRAQQACFGRTEDGLPNAGGWLLLTLAPLLLIGCLLAAYHLELVAGWRALCRSNWGRRVLCLLGVALAAELWMVSGRIVAGVKVRAVDFSAGAVDELPDAYPRGNQPAADFSLVDQHGRQLQLSQFRGRPVILTFAFAHCRTVCPAIIRTAKSAVAKLSKADVALVFVTLDPWRDTPSSLPTFAKEWKLEDNEFILSGQVDVVNAVVEAYGMGTKRDPATGDVVHPPLVFVIDANGTLAYTFNNPPAHWLVRAVQLLASTKN